MNLNQLNTIEKYPVIFSEEIGNAILSELEQNKYVFIEGKNLFPESLRESFNELANAFNKIKTEADSLPKYLRSSFESFELARGLVFGRFDVSTNHEVSPNLQTKYFTFENTELYQNVFLKTLVKATATLLNPQTAKGVTVFLSRHTQSASPLYLHQDRSAGRVVVYNIHRSKSGIDGGESLIGDRTKKIVAEKLLSEPLDAYIVNNHEFYHGANAINISEKGSVRDVLIMQVVEL
jgi:hypothetical protein